MYKTKAVVSNVNLHCIKTVRNKDKQLFTLEQTSVVFDSFFRLKENQKNCAKHGVAEPAGLFLFFYFFFNMNLRKWNFWQNQYGIAGHWIEHKEHQNVKIIQQNVFFFILGEIASQHELFIIAHGELMFFFSLM
jgi:hypothetical protein